MNEFEKQNRERLINLLEDISSAANPKGWESKGKFAIGELLEIGFSKASEMLLVISSRGRGVIDCQQGQLVARDEETEGEWYRPQELLCQGIGPIQDEPIQIAGQSGGGLLTRTKQAETLELVSPDWPKSDLIFCPPFQSAVIERHQRGCVRIASGYIRAFGFSWTGDTFAYATSSDVSIFSRAA